MKAKEAEKLKIGQEIKLLVLMSKNTFRLKGKIKEIHAKATIRYDAHIVIKVTDYFNPTYPADESYKIGNVQPVFLRKIRDYEILGE